MKKAILILCILCLFLLDSCVTTTKYSQSNGLKTRLAEYSIIQNEDIDGSLEIEITPNVGREDGFCFNLKNISSKDIQVDWDNSYLVINGVTHRCIHSGTRFMDKSSPQVSSIVATGSSISDCLFPENNILMNSSYPYQGWIQKPLNSPSGNYSISIISGGKQKSIKGTYIMLVKNEYVATPDNSYTITTENQGMGLLIGVSVVVSLLSLLLLL